jgi:nitroimidazol reductase NimA-like FMN-containing flavoprotein (pyridoxamine 5'-phosphate oxidase superfamily)
MVRLPYFVSSIWQKGIPTRSNNRIDLWAEALPKKPTRESKEVKLSATEIDFLKSNELCRFATASRKGEPHVVPVSYMWDQDFVYIVTDYGTRKLKNLRENPHAAVLVDTGGTQKLLLISGPAEIIEKGEEYRRLYKLFYSKLSWVKRDPWKEGEAPFIKITPGFKTGWGLGK